MIDLMKLEIAEREIVEKISVPHMYNNILGLYGDLEDGMVCCPFHGERTPSFSYAKSIGIWKCFGECSQYTNGGDTIELYKFYIFKKAGERISRTDAIKRLMEYPDIKYKLSVRDLNIEHKEFANFEDYMKHSIRKKRRGIPSDTSLTLSKLERENDIEMFLELYDGLLKKGWKSKNGNEKEKID